MRKYIIKLLFLSSALVLAGCSSLSSNRDIAPVQDAAKNVSKNTDSKSLGLEQQALKLKKFEYITAQKQYLVFLDTLPVLIQVNNGKTKFFYQAGKLIAVQDSEGVHHFNNEKLSPKQTELLAEGKKLQSLFAYNSADKGVSRISTGDDAKLNYLCIAKIQQVAQTKRVFRSSANRANSNSRLVADVRLNGNQFYKMDCQLEGNAVTRLSLIKK